MYTAVSTVLEVNTAAEIKKCCQPSITSMHLYAFRLCSVCVSNRNHMVQKLDNIHKLYCIQLQANVCIPPGFQMEKMKMYHYFMYIILYIVFHSVKNAWANPAIRQQNILQNRHKNITITERV